MTINLVSMLGMNLDDVVKSSFALRLNDKPKTEKIEDRFYTELRHSGLSFIASLESRVMAIQLYADGYQDYSGYTGNMPEGISFSNSRQEVRNRLGMPSAFGGGNLVPFFGKAPSWDRFDRTEYSLHLQYTDNKASINLVTIMRLNSVCQ